MGDFKEYELANSPPWLLELWGEAWALVQGLFADAHAEGTREAVALRFVVHAPLDALDEHGADRQILLAPGEALEQFRTRLRQAWDAWAKAGTGGGILLQLEAAGIVSATIYEGPPRWDGFEWGDGTLWGTRVGFTTAPAQSWGSFTWGSYTWGPRAMNWANWVLVIHEPHPFSPPASWGQRTWGDGWLWGFSTPAPIEYTKAIVRKWQPAHVRNVGVVVEFQAGASSVFQV
jgi:hypothetical protein